MEIRLTAGELRHRLTIERKPTGKNEYQEIDLTGDWPLVAKRWGSLEALSSRNAEVAKGFNANVGFECKLRYFASIDNDCRIRHGDRTFNVEGVIQDPRKIWTLVFLAEKQAP